MSFKVTPDIKTLFQDNVFISTRPAGSSIELKILCENAGATLVDAPMIELSAMVLQQNEINEIQQLKHFDWIIFTSANGVKYFYQLMQHVGLPTAAGKIAVIGEKTNAALNSVGQKADFICQNSDGEHFAKELKTIFQDQFPKVLWPTGNLAPEKNQKSFEKISKLSRINVYKTSYAKRIEKSVLDRIIEDAYTMVLLYSSSALHSLYAHSKGAFDIKKIRVACIGSTTYKACIAMGITPLLRSKTASNKGMIEALGDYLLEIENTK